MRIAQCTLLLILFGGLLLTGCSLQTTASVKQPLSADQNEKLQAMNAAAGDMYLLAKEGKFPEARERLLQFTNQMTQISYHNVTSMEGLNALTALVAEARAIYTQVKFSPQEGLLAAAKIRLAADAMVHKETPMWMQYRKVFKADADKLRGSVRAKDATEASEHLQDFNKHYQLIRSAILLSRDASLVEKLDSWFIFMHGLLTQQHVDFKKVGVGALHTDELIAELFGSQEQPAFVPAVAGSNTLLWAAVLSSIIITVLVYVGWRKYSYLGKS
jgi:sporulation protein YpjB